MRPQSPSEPSRRPQSPIALALLLAAAVAGSPAVEAAVRRAFVTSSAGTGNFGTWPGDLDDGLVGIAAANRICQNAAAASSLSIPNPQLFRAWISDGTTDAYCNVLGLEGTIANHCLQPSLPPPDAGPWRMANGATYFAGSLGDLIDGQPRFWFPLSYDENFDPVPNLASSEVWTGTLPDGHGNDQDCNNWTTASSNWSGVAGTALGTVDAWTLWTPGLCNGPRRLLCLESGPGDPMAPLWSPASLVFVTSETYSADLGSEPEAGGATGLAAGDAICRSRAAAAHLPAPASFVAWLADGAWDPELRITSNGPFKKIDGISIAGSKADLLDGTISTSVHQDERGADISSGRRFFSGADAWGQANGRNCQGWTSATAYDLGVGTEILARDPIWADDGGVYECEYVARLLCISNAVTIFWDGFDYTGDASRWSSAVP